MIIYIYINYIPIISITLKLLVFPSTSAGSDLFLFDRPSARVEASPEAFEEASCESSKSIWRL